MPGFDRGLTDPDPSRVCALCGGQVTRQARRALCNKHNAATFHRRAGQQITPAERLRLIHRNWRERQAHKP